MKTGQVGRQLKTQVSRTSDVIVDEIPSMIFASQIQRTVMIETGLGVCSIKVYLEIKKARFLFHLGPIHTKYFYT